MSHPAPVDLAVPIGPDDHCLNDAAASMVLLEYGDYEDPTCAEGRYILRELLRDLGKNLCYVYRHFPEPELHPQSVPAAEAAEAADMQGKFWLMHDRLFDQQTKLDRMVIHELARGLPVDIAHFQRDLDSGDPARRVREDRSGAQRSGVQGTPTFFANGRRVVGAFEYDVLRQHLEATARPVERRVE